MARRVLYVDDVITPDHLGCYIARQWLEWNTLRSLRIESWREIHNYIFATDTTTTTNSKLPWKNSTTTPKLCQIRDNLHANYMATMFPKRKWFTWKAENNESNTQQKKKAVEGWAKHTFRKSNFVGVMDQLVADYIEYGDAFVTVDWVDDRQELPDKTQVGYKGPVPVRISPLDIVFNPTSTEFTKSPKIVRSFVTIGDVKERLERMAGDENRELYEELFKYLMEYRENVSSFGGDVKVRDDYLRVDGFTDFRSYLGCNMVELLTYYGDIYDSHTGEFLRNYEVVVIDRHKILQKRPSPSLSGTPNIFKSGWRKRPDNLWSMGPLENLVGLQYRVDHLENQKADLMDLTVLPPLKIKGDVEDFEWGPMSRIFVGDEGDVEIMSPDVNALNVNLEIAELLRKMEEMAGSPREAMGFRTPGEKTKYEVQRIENAGARLFQAKSSQFQNELVHPVMNAMLEMWRRHGEQIEVEEVDDEFGTVTFVPLTPEDVTGMGEIYPMGAEHFAEKAEKLQELNTFMASPIGANPKVMVHISGIKMARMLEELLEWETYELVEPFVGISEDADAQRLANTSQEQVMMEAQTPSGMSEDDTDLPFI